MDTKYNLIDNSVVDLKDSDKTSLKNSEYASVYRAILFKTERLISAAHLVTGLMDTKDSLRWDLRRVCLGLLSDFYSIGHCQVGNDKKFVSSKTYSDIAHIISLLDVGLSGGLISSMNHEILKAEYIKLKLTLEKLKIADEADSFLLPENFFGPSLDLEIIKDIGHMSFTDSETNRQSLGPSKFGKPSSYRRQSVPKKSISVRGVDKLSRQGMILQITKDGALYTIKDIIAKLLVIAADVDCSEKTIQRDLISLVSNKALIKLGERRWSKYSIAKQAGQGGMG